MISYNPKDWYKFIFNFHKADTLRTLFPLLIVIGLYTWGVAWLEIEYFNLPKNEHLKNISTMHTLLSFAISMLLVFRTNTAYDRWWEGRKLWGALVNNSRNLAMKLNSMLQDNDKTDRHFFAKLIAMYASILSQHLGTEETRLALDDHDHPELKRLDTDKHIPNQVASLLTHRINRLYKEGKITGDQLIVLNGEMLSFTDICGACERIKNTPIPYSYSAFLKKFIFLFSVTLPFSFAISLGYLAIPVVTIIFYVLASLELIAEEIEDPFGDDPNDLPTRKIASNIEKHVAEILL
ncbi:MAG: bestrophin family protein [Chitinophagaceae bacterium]